MGFAPMENPQIAICVYVENGGWGATYGVPIGALMMEQFIRGHLSPESEARAQQMASSHLIAYEGIKKPQNEIEEEMHNPRIP